MAAQVVVTMSADEAKLWRAQQKIFDQQSKMNAEMRKGERISQATGDSAVQSAKRMQTGYDGTIKTLKGLSAQYLTLQAGMQVLNNLAAEYDRIQQASLEKTRSVAAAQQEAIKNLQGLSVLQKEEFLTAIVDQIQNETGFAGREQLSLAIASGISAGGTVEQVKSAVKAAAQLNLQTPDSLETTAASAVDIARQTGLSDAEKNLGFVLNLGAVSRVQDPRALNEIVGEFLGNTIATTSGQTTEEAASEAGALFATLNQKANDVRGRSSSTATMQISSYLRKFFAEQDTIEDPGTIKKRLEAIQSDAELRKQFLSSLPGEAQFKIPFEELVTAGSDAFKMFNEDIKTIKFSEDAFRENAEQVKGLTSQLEIANAGTAARANVEQFNLVPDIAARAEIGKIAEDTLPRVRSSGVSGVVQSIVEGVNGYVVPNFFPDARSFAGYTKEQFAGRRSILESGGITPDEQTKINLIDKQIKAIERIIDRLDRDDAKRSLEEAAESTKNAAKSLDAAASRQLSNAARQQAASVGIL